MATKPLPTDPHTDSATEEACHLGALGYSTKMIQRATGFTPCQVNYRLHQQGIKRKDYRDGTSAVAQLVLATTKKIVLSELRQHYVETGRTKESKK